MKVTLVRHAEVIEEYLGKYNGHIDISISQHGKEQAQKLAKQLNAETFDKIYCSDLVRAKETLVIFNLQIAPIYTDKLREKSWGIHEGKSFNEIEKMGIKYENFEQWINKLDGEDLETFQQRIVKYFYATIFKDEGDNVLVVTHSGVIKTLLHIKNKISLEEAFAIKLPYASSITFTL